MSPSLIEPSLRVPALDRITLADLEGATDGAIRDTRARYHALKRERRAADFANTVVTLEGLFHGLNDVQAILRHFDRNKTSDEIIELVERVDAACDRLTKTVYQDQELAARFMVVYEARDILQLDQDDHALLERLYRRFQTNGSFLASERQQRLNEIDQRLISLCNLYGANCRKAARQQAVLFSASDMSGVPKAVEAGMKAQAAEVAAALKQAAHPDSRKSLEAIPQPILDALGEADDAGQLSNWRLFFPERLAVDNLLETAESRFFREAILRALDRIGTEAPYDNRPVIVEIQRLRHERAMLLNEGEPERGAHRHFADFQLRDTMAGSIERVQTMLDELTGPLLARFEGSLAAITSFAVEQGGPAELEPYDVAYWAERYRRHAFRFDHDALSRHLELESVLRQFFAHAERLFGLRFKQTNAYPKIDGDVLTFDVEERAGGTRFGILHVDMFARPDEKRGGAWMSILQAGSAERPLVVTINLNWARPEPGRPVHLAQRQLETLYHEAGHALNGLLGTQSRYRALNGTTGRSSDAVEIPSMIQECWATLPEALRRLGVSEAVLVAHAAAERFFAEWHALRLIQNSVWDLKFHSMSPDEFTDHAEFQRAALLDDEYAPYLRPYPLPRFDHLFASPLSPYASGYYGYLWADVHAQHGFSLFTTAGDAYDPVLSQRLKSFYSAGKRVDANAAYEAFAGGPAQVTALLREAGALEAEPAGQSVAS